MPVKSAEAKERKRARRMQRDREKAAAKRLAAGPKPAVVRKGAPAYRNQLPRLPSNMSKADLRRMLAEAMAETARICG